MNGKWLAAAAIFFSLHAHADCTARTEIRDFIGPATLDLSGELPRSQFHFLWPNLGVNIFPGRPNISIGPIVPHLFRAPPTDWRHPRCASSCSPSPRGH